MKNLSNDDDNKRPKIAKSSSSMFQSVSGFHSHTWSHVTSQRTRRRILFTPKRKQQPTKGHLTNMATSCCHTGSLVETVEIHVLLPATKQMDLRLTPTAEKDSNHLCSKRNDIM